MIPSLQKVSSGEVTSNGIQSPERSVGLSSPSSVDLDPKTHADEDIVTKISLNHMISEPSVTSTITRSRQDFFLKLSMFIPIPFMFSFCIYLFHQNHVTIKDVSLILVVFHSYIEIMWNTLVCCIIFFKTKYMRYFRSLHGQFDEYSPVSMIYGIKEYPNTVVSSLSAVFQIKGTIFNTGGLLHSWTTLLTTMMILLLNWENVGSISKYNGLGIISGYVAFISKCAFVMINVFELNQKGRSEFNKYFACLHYFGAAVYVGSAVIPCLIATEFSILAIIISVLGYSCLIIWLVFTEKCPEEINGGNYKIQVHKLSLQILFVEMTGNLLASFALLWYLYLII